MEGAHKNTIDELIRVGTWKSMNPCLEREI